MPRSSAISSADSNGEDDRSIDNEAHGGSITYNCTMSMARTALPDKWNVHLYN